VWFKTAGTGESFVFRLQPSAVMYRWSKLNQYFQFASGDSIAVGGGGHFALWLDSDLHFGNSGRCDTFRSPCLASNEEFLCHDVELWQVGNGILDVRATHTTCNPNGTTAILLSG
jgi:hypothetical protein